MPSGNVVEIGGGDVPRVRVGAGEPLLLIAGPCVIESAESCLEQAKAVGEIAREAGWPLVFKASFDKANRTSVESYRGPGLDEGLRILADVRREAGVPVLTDIHTPAQAERVGGVVDVIQIPAFLCRQTDVLVAAGRTGKPVNVKKGQFLAPPLMAHAAAKVLAGAAEADKSGAGARAVMLTERGTAFGHGDLVVDMRGLATMRATGWPVILDATHSVQRPGGRGASSGGDREMVEVLVRAAVAAGVDGLFIETHPDPAKALCDRDSQLPHAQLAGLLAQAKAIREALA
ncbi:MAG: 3-deoxy-8-phosphooctulonate synthase [Planctomycetota bacterium]|jgi:2-dehydro-3-deoxyphosphooctonate aldolase (KDO 8-P synthase)